ncbi:phage head-binding domain-containing protein [Enterobacter cloacae]|uniref:phage head-binding domain-containing protein n=1 Tax=Enterobacter cloacae TaxID=550 RepID=UPI001F177509|nr:phage head-binding domain-containing protein [Enterobacter cloacae]
MSDISANIVISMPSQLFTMARSFKAVANGKIYIGQIDTDPTIPSNQIQVYIENEDGSHIPVSQPIIINAGGYPVYNGNITKFVTVQGHSMAVYDAYNSLQFYFPNVLKYDPDQLRDELDKGYGGLYLRRATVSEIASGLFPVGAQLTVTDRADGHFTVVSGGTPNGTYILDAGSGKTAVYQIPSDGYVRVKALGGRSGVDSTAAIVAAHSLSNLVHYDDDDVYELAYDVNTSNKSLVTYSNQTGIRITGSAATIKDVSTFNSGTSYLVDIFKFVACKDVYINVNFDATPLPDITAAFPEGLGYKGSSAIYLEGYCEHITVNNRMSNVRYGIRQGGYSNPAFGGANNIHLRTRCFQVGYPIACYTAQNVVLDIDSNIQHRAAYLSGVTNCRGTVALAGFTYAEISVVLGDSIQTAASADADRRVNSCKNIHLNLVDRGSTGTVSSRALCGITQSWRAPNVAHNDIHFHIQMKTNNATRTYAGFRVQSVPGVGWMAGNIFSDIKVSGVIDRSDQTLSGSTWADYSIDGIEAGEVGPYPNSPSFDGIDFSDLRIIKGAVTGNISQLLVPNATGVINLKNARQGITLSINAPNARVILTNAALASVSGAGIIFPTKQAGDSGWRVDDDGFLYQWMKVYYNVTANTDQTFAFPKSFATTANIPDIQTDATGRTFAVTGLTLSGVTVRCSASPATLLVKVSGF